MSKYLREFKCKQCGFKRDTTLEEENEMTIRTRENPFVWPRHCGVTMNLHPYRPTRYKFCNNLSCVFAEGGYCGCTCEGTFHGTEVGRTQKVKYIY